MAALEIRGSRGHDLIALDEEKYIVGRADDNGIVIEHDTAVSTVHAVLERMGRRWFVRDLASRNGTFVNGERLLGERALRNDDEILVGKTMLVYSERSVTRYPPTTPQEPPPRITPKERETLIELCRPILLGNLFVEPTSARGIASAMFITEAGVKQHLSKLYDKFGILPGEGDQRRRLANEAIQRGVITKKDLLPPEPDEE